MDISYIFSFKVPVKNEICMCVYLEKYTPNLCIADFESLGQNDKF